MVKKYNIKIKIKIIGTYIIHHGGFKFSFGINLILREYFYKYLYYIYRYNLLIIYLSYFITSQKKIKLLTPLLHPILTSKNIRQPI